MGRVEHLARRQRYLLELGRERAHAGFGQRIEQAVAERQARRAANWADAPEVGQR